MTRFLLALVVLCISVELHAQTMRPSFTIVNDNSSTTITAAAYVQLDSSTDGSCDSIDVFNSSSSVIFLAIGASGKEIPIKYNFAPASSEIQHVHIPIAKGVRLSAKADADASMGYLIVNCLQ